MNDLERRALLGDKQAQEECTRRGILLPCPFCGGEAEMHEAEAMAEKVTRKNDIPKGSRFLRMVSFASGSTYYEFRRKTFVPKCCETACLGRLQKQYRTREQAISAWNTRPAPSVGRCDQCQNWRGEPADEYAPCSDCDGVMERNNYCRNYEPKEAANEK